MVAPIQHKHQIANLKRGQSGQVSHFTDERIASKLMAMGLLPGSKVQFMRKAPFGGGCYIKADNIVIALRQREAASIMLR